MPRLTVVGSRLLAAAGIVLGLSVAALAQPVPAVTAMTAAQDGGGPVGQDTAAALLSGELTADERRDLLARLDDSQVRALLLEHLSAGAETGGVASRGRSAGFIGRFEEVAGVLRDRHREIFAAAPDLPGIPAFMADRLNEGRDASDLLLVLVGFAFILAGGYGAEWLFRRLLKAHRQQNQRAAGSGAFAECGFLLLRVGLDLVAIGVFWLVAVGIFFALHQEHDPTRWTVLTYLWAVVIVRLIALASRALLSPQAPQLRMVPLSDAGSRFIHNRIVCLAAIGAFGFLTGGLFELLGMESQLRALYMTIIGVVFVAAIVVMIWQARGSVAEAIRGEAPADNTAFGQMRNLFAVSWHILATVYVLAIWVLAQVEAVLSREPTVGAAVGSLVIVVALPLLDAGLGGLLSGYLADRRAAGGDAEDEAEGYEPVARRGLRVVLVLGAVVLLARFWGVNIFALSSAGLGAEATRAVVEVGITVLLAYLVWQFARIAIDRQLAREGGGAAPAPGDEGGHGGGSRLKTLLPLLRRFLFITIVVMAVMTSLSALGVQIGPLLAGAGVIGIAIGFGAQTLVRDVVSGVFFLLDDAFRTGEYIDVGDVKGTVERITMRSLVLRHHRGPLNIVPFGEITHLTNFSRDWVIMKLEFRVTYDTDVNKVKKIFKQIGAELMADEELGPNFIEPLKSQGVLAMEDSAMVLRAKFMAKPGEQFTIRKEVYRRVQQAFRDNGIEFAHRQVTVHVPGVSDDGQQDAGEAGPAPGTPSGPAPDPKMIEKAASAAALAVLAEEEKQAQEQAGKATG